MSSPRAFFYVQHLLGIGHLKRAATIARAIAAGGVETTLVSGGEEVPVLESEGLDFLQLPSVRALDRSFKVLADGTGKAVDEAWKERRRRFLLDAFERISPQVLIVELFPFGRRQLRFELIPLLEAARARRPRPAIVSSVRDILVEKEKPERNLEMVEWAEAYFDVVMVHGDPGLIPFDTTFPLARRLGERIRYTGYVVDHDRIAARAGDQGTGEVIVSSGGGAVGEELLRTAMEARPMTVLGDLTWRLLAGHGLPEAAFETLCAAAPAGVIVERARKDFVDLLGNCRLSVSQGGYNTVMEVLATVGHGVVVPYSGGEESEQTLRAELLRDRGLIHVVGEEDLTAASLAEAVDAAAAAGPPAQAAIRTDGAETSARIIAELADAGEAP